MAYGKPSSSTPWALYIGGGVLVVAVITLLIVRETGKDGATDDGGSAAGDDALALEIPDDGEYPDPPDDGVWDTKPLSEQTYVQVTAESTCRAQRFQGPPENLVVEMNRIYYHYETTANDVAWFAAEINADDGRAIEIGERIAGAIERCP